MTDDASKDDSDRFPRSLESDLSHGDDQSLVDIFQILTDERSRYVVECLTSATVDVFDLETLVDCVVEREVEAGETETADHRQSVAIELHHNSLPKLDEQTVIDYDPRSKTVRYRGKDRLEASLELFENFGE